MLNNTLFPILILLFFQSCTEKKKTLPRIATEEKVHLFQLAAVKAEQPGFTITLPAELKAYESVSIYPKVKGFVQKIYADRGTRVRRGQLLAQLEAPEIGEQLAARTSTSGATYQKFLFSKQSYQRLKEASKKNGAVAVIELERAFAQYLADSAAYNSSRSEASATGQLQNYLSITAPFDGMISSRNISPGALVGDNGVNPEPLFQLSQENKLRLVVAVPERQSQALSEKTKATFTLIDYPGKTFIAVLSRNSGSLDSRTKSLTAEFDVDNADNLLRSGQYAKVALHLQRRQPTLWVPSSSVVQAQSGVFVVKNAGGLASRVPVETGLVIDGFTEIFGGLNAGDEILLAGSEEIKEGTVIGHN